MNALQVLQAAAALAPLIERLLPYLTGQTDEFPEELAKLPATLKSEIALSRRRALNG